jgi:hypothetical protein
MEALSLNSGVQLADIGDRKAISYSQFNMYKSCPHQWKLTYVDGNKTYEPSIYTIFGTAFHETLQEYLTVMYTKSAKEANQLGVHTILKDRMIAEYKREVEVFGNHFSTPEELSEFYKDGLAILEFFIKKRGSYFSKRNCELLGIETPLLIETNFNENVLIRGFLDVVMREHDKIKIWDIKTSTWGWKPNKKKLEGDQLRLYKRYFAKQYGYDENDIDVEYFIVKRKLYENAEFPQKRIQLFKPPNAKVSLNKTEKSLESFVSNAFMEDGSYNINGDYPAYKNACMYCPFKTNHELCPPKNRILKKSE